MITYYTCTQVTPEVYEAYQKYMPSSTPVALQDLLAVILCFRYERVILYPVHPTLNTRHLREFGSTNPLSINGDSNVLVSAEEFLSQLFILELEQ